MRAAVQLRREVAGQGPTWYRGEVAEAWLERGWVERYVDSGAGAWYRDGTSGRSLWLPVGSVARLLVEPGVEPGGDGADG